ncbi:hypothetical protein ACKUFS_11545 [Pseudomonas cannabina]|uniref:hypothetical protein n=1 Tax=Pseudomonas syringae group TaxID=136849 RepID=UPI0006B90E4A|nr:MULTISPECIES: hypothetical protein [Pseudomonas syringae group]KPB77935.1 Uncharacterized protein AC507_1644 [Pseudomonas syringae pv. maculicola]QQN20122.1 hypothetical protein JGS08_15915 [Pseudomonas cannabina pv. alisalensis]
MSNIKYTSDGKKVLVVGKLNAEQTIVQEIFVSAGQEIPSGENFVVKSLHDAPAESWKEKNLRELELRYESDRKKLQGQIDEQERRLSLERDKAKLQTSALLQFVKNSDESQLETLKNFMAGKITHLFVAGYYPEIISWTDSNKVYDADSFYHHARLEGIKLVSLMGKSDGDLSYQLNQYRDRSGSSKTVYPCTSYEAALAMAQAQLDEDSAGYVAGDTQYFNVPEWQKIEGIEIPAAVIERYEALADEARVRRIEMIKKELSDLEAKAPTKANPAA